MVWLIQKTIDRRFRTSVLALGPLSRALALVRSILQRLVMPLLRSAHE